MLDFRKSLINATLRKVLKRLHYPLEVMLTCVRWYPDASKQILQQHRRAGPPSHQTNHPTDARVQVVLERANYHRRNRNHAHDSQGADELPRRLSHVRSTAVLQPRSLITRSATQLFSARVRYRDRTARVMLPPIRFWPRCRRWTGPTQ